MRQRSPEVVALTVWGKWALISLEGLMSFAFLTLFI
jgi:hypothetical protein